MTKECRHTCIERLSLSISFCQKCAPIINQRRRKFDIILIKESRCLTKTEVCYIIGMSHDQILQEIK